jgi:RHS repeat-associated protein
VRRAQRLAATLAIGVSVIVTAAMLTPIVAAPPAGASAPATPWHQCPYVSSYSPSCETLIVVNADRSIDVYSDSSVRDFDGGDDTLVGVQNNSGLPVTSLGLDGGSHPIFGFDGDGLCTFITCTWANPTGYEGPITSFVPASTSVGEVNFTGGGVPAGGSTYFSLEDTVVAGTVLATPGSALNPSESWGGSNPTEPCFSCWLKDKINFGAPVDASTGNFWHTFDELSIPGRGPGLDLSLTYNSQAAPNASRFGNGWIDSYDMSLTIPPGGTPVTVAQENGSRVTFTLSSGVYTADARVQATLTHNLDGTWTFLRRNRDTFTFDSGGNLTAITNLNGYSTTLTYTSGQLTTVTDSEGRTLTYVYSSGFVSSVTDNTASRQVQFGYTSGDLASITDVGGGVTTMSYDSSHQMLQLLDPNQQSATTKHYLTNVYDGNGRVTSQTDFASRVTTFDYTSIAGATKITDPKGNVTVEAFSGGLPTTITRGYGTSSAASWVQTFDPSTFQLTDVVDPNLDKTHMTYDTAGNMLTQTTGIDTTVPGSLGRTTTWTYNTHHNVTSMQDAKGVTTTYGYDTAGINLMSVSTPIDTHSGSNLAVGYTYDPSHAGDVATMTDPSGQVWSYGYDTYGLRQTVTDPNGKVTTSCYDTVGRRTRLITPKGHAASVTCTSGSPTYTTQYTTNAFGDPLTVTDALGHQTVTVYDADRNVSSVTDANSHQTAYAYDLDNELTQVTRPDTSTLQTAYWDDGSLKSQTDGAGQVTNYTYDPLAHLATVVDPLSRTTTYTSDAVGNQLSKQDPGGNCAATPKTGCTTYAYLATDDLHTITYSDGTTPNVTYGYDADGQRTSMSDGQAHTSVWTWDSVHRMTSSTDGTNAVTAYDYNLSARQETITYPGSKTVTRHYDVAGRQDSVQDWSSHTTTFSYDDNGNLIGQADPNTTTVTYTPDAADRLMGITHTHSATTLASFTYTRDNTDLLTGVTSTGVGTTETYGHNSLDQLTSVSGTTQNYAYDAADNLSALTNGTLQKYDVANQLCYASPTTSANACGSPPSDATTYGYDSRGNRTTVTPPAANGDQLGYGYDQANRLATATLPSSASTEGQYQPLSPVPRVLDTRSASRYGTCYRPNNTGVTCTGLANNNPLTVKIAGKAGQSGGTVPSTGIAAVALEVTAFNPGANSSMVLYPSNVTNPGTRDLSLSTGETTTNTVVVPLGPDGRVTVDPNTTADVAIDVEGWYAAPDTSAGGAYVPQVSTRIASSITPSGTCTPSPCATLGAGNDVTVQVTGLGNVPTTAVSAVAMTLTATGTSAAGSGVVWPADETQPAGRSISYQNNDTVSQLVIAKLSSDGKIKIHANTGGFDFTIDVAGWYTTATGNTGSLFTPMTSTRILSTVSGTWPACVGTCPHPIASGGSVTLQVSGNASVPAGATAVTVNLSALNTTATGSLTVGPTGTSGTRVVRFKTGEAASDTAIVKVSASGQIDIGTISSAADVLVDVTGYYNNTWTYTYNGDGLRTSKTSPTGTVTTYTWDQSGALPYLIAETTDGNTTRYVYGPGGLPIEDQQPDASFRYYHHDQLGSTRLITDASGTNIGTATYNPYGKRSSKTGATTPLGYGGQYTDAETGYQYLRARYYDPGTGQFTTADPIRAITRAPYDLAADSPLDSVDPTGLWGWNPIDDAVQAWNDTGGKVVHWSSKHPAAAALGAAAVVGTVACVIAEPCGVAEAIAFLGGGAAAEEEAATNDVTAAECATEAGSAITEADLTSEQASNFGRYASKLPVKAEPPSIAQLGNGSVEFSARVPGEVPGSYATYTKTVDVAGNTVGYVKTTVGPDGSVISVKDKFNP